MPNEPTSSSSPGPLERALEDRLHVPDLLDRHVCHCRPPSSITARTFVSIQIVSRRDAILERAVEVASEEGLEGLTIGRLSSELGLSKSGLFGHFGSKEELQLAAVDAAERDLLPRGHRAGAGRARGRSAPARLLRPLGRLPRAQGLQRRLLLRGRLGGVRRPSRARCATSCATASRPWLARAREAGEARGRRGSGPARVRGLTRSSRARTRATSSSTTRSAFARARRAIERLLPA